MAGCRFGLRTILRLPQIRRVPGAGGIAQPEIGADGVLEHRKYQPRFAVEKRTAANQIVELYRDDGAHLEHGASDGFSAVGERGLLAWSFKTLVHRSQSFG